MQSGAGLPSLLCVSEQTASLFVLESWNPSTQFLLFRHFVSVLPQCVSWHCQYSDRQMNVFDALINSVHFLKTFIFMVKWDFSSLIHTSQYGLVQTPCKSRAKLKNTWQCLPFPKSAQHSWLKSVSSPGRTSDILTSPAAVLSIKHICRAHSFCTQLHSRTGLNGNLC